jgi:hypothetical protein
MASTSRYASVITALDLPQPSWVTDTDDKARVAAYDGYGNMYENNVGTFSLALRGSEDRPVYVPSARKIIETTARYLAKSWSFTVASLSPDAQSAVSDPAGITLALNRLVIREEFLSIFSSLKRNLLKYGDALFHISANYAAPAGSRIRIREIHPRTYFRIPDPADDQGVIGCYIVDLIMADDGKTQIARRMGYRYGPTGGVVAQLGFFEPGAWDDRWVGHPALKPVAVPEAYSGSSFAALLAGTTLPSSVTQLPVYHFRNRRDSSEPFGTSQISGIETLITAVNQGATDEDVTLALQGLGCYVTDAKSPLNEDGTEGDWIIAPGEVLEVQPNTSFARVDGVKTVVPFQEHLDFLRNEMKESSGISNTAIGQVDAAVVASGVALRLDMAPILAQNEETETELLSRLDQMFFDIMTMWMPVDGTSVPAGLTVINSFADPLPIDRAGTLDEILKLVAAGLMSREFAIDYIAAKLGYQFPADMLAKVASEQDTIASRLYAELAGSGIPNDPNAAPIGDPNAALPGAPTATPAATAPSATPAVPGTVPALAGA